MKLVILTLLIIVRSFASDFKCDGNDGLYRVELKYMESSSPVLISYVGTEIWSSIVMDTTQSQHGNNFFLSDFVRENR